MPSTWSVSKNVSIHAPAQGATGVLQRLRGNAEVSIHAPAQGATLALLMAVVFPEPVSIHAPAQGAT